MVLERKKYESQSLAHISTKRNRSRLSYHRSSGETSFILENQHDYTLVESICLASCACGLKIPFGHMGPILPLRMFPFRYSCLRVALAPTSASLWLTPLISSAQREASNLESHIKTGCSGSMPPLGFRQIMTSVFVEDRE